VSGTAAVLDKALAGERIDEAEALTLLESRDLLKSRTAAMATRRAGPSPSATSGII